MGKSESFRTDDGKDKVNDQSESDERDDEIDHGSWMIRPFRTPR
jgi:hypothetical protein